MDEDQNSSSDDYFEQMLENSMKEDAIGVGRQAGYRGKRLISAMNNIAKWKESTERHGLMEPFLQDLLSQIPDDTKKWTDEDRIIAMQVALIRSTEKADVVQRAIEHISRIKGLITKKPAQENTAELGRELQEDMRRMAQALKKRVEAEVGMPQKDSDEAGNSAMGD